MLRCPRCGKLFYKRQYGYNPNAKAKCPYCGRSFVIYPKREISRIVKIFENPFDAREFCVKVNTSESL